MHCRVAPRNLQLVYEIQEACWWLNDNEYEIHMMWIPSHVKARRNERANQLADDAVKNGMEWHAHVRPSDFLCLEYGCWKVGRVAGRVVTRGDMFTLFGQWFLFCLGLGVLTATQSSFP
jgi:hypothetical protein